LHFSFFAAARPPNRSIAQLLNRHFSLHFFSPRASASPRKFFFSVGAAAQKTFFPLTPAFRACYKEAGAIHIGVRRHTN
jgi:hypothetical protein